MTTYLELCTYFEAIPTSITGIKSAVVGADEQTLDAQTGNVTYPLLRVETPAFRFVHADEAAETTEYKLRLFVISNEPTNDYRAQNAVLSATQTLMKQLWRKLWADADANQFDLVLSDADGDAIRAWSGDNCFGWYLDLKIALYTATC